MSIADKKGLLSSKTGMAKINNGTAGQMGLELSRRIDRICINGEEGIQVSGKHRGVWRYGGLEEPGV